MYGKLISRGGSRNIGNMWRMAHPGDEECLVEMSLRLYSEDPGLIAVRADNMLATLKVLRTQPSRGRAVVLEIEGRPSGYALLIPYWSNEFGGDICAVDELFVAPEHRNQGHGKSLFGAIAKRELWPDPIVAIALGVTPGNVRAQRLYERLGFTAVGTSMVWRL